MSSVFNDSEGLYGTIVSRCLVHRPHYFARGECVSGHVARASSPPKCLDRDWVGRRRTRSRHGHVYRSVRERQGNVACENIRFSSSSPLGTSPVAKNEEKRMFSLAKGNVVYRQRVLQTVTSLRVVSLVSRGHDLRKIATINPQQEATLSLWKKLVPRESAGSRA